MATAMSSHPSWPSGPTDGHYPDDESAQDHGPANQTFPDQGPALAAIGEMAGLLQDTRSNLLTDGAVLGAIMIGIALEAAFSAQVVRMGAMGIINCGLLCGLLLCLLRAVTLLVLAGRPVLNALSELRWRTGAPLDPRAPWLTLPPMEANPPEWTWIRAHLLLSAARLTRYRIQLADTWTYATAVSFLLWTAVILLGL
jgi:hypothetical protein